MATRVGTNLGRYEIDAEIGHGAMGVVYRARDPKIDRTVAIKTISLSGLEPDAEQEYRERFVVEARAAGRLFHPRIVTIFDVAEDPHTLTPYIVMEYVSGRSLEEVLCTENGTLPLDTALQVTQELAEALDYAHAQGIVHRDVKPSNIIVAEDGHPKIADFGIAKLNALDLPQTGHTLGTPAYMSPEQLRGDPVDGRSDLFSLGVILYQLLTGHRPFQGNSTRTISFKVLNRDPVPATALNAELCPELGHVIARAIAKDPSQRYQTGMEMAVDLRDLRGSILPPSSNGESSQMDHGRELPADWRPRHLFHEHLGGCSQDRSFRPRERFAVECRSFQPAMATTERRVPYFRFSCIGICGSLANNANQCCPCSHKGVHSSRSVQGDGQFVNWPG